MAKTFTRTILRDSSKLSEEFLLPMSMVVAITLIAAIVSAIDIVGPQPMLSTQKLAMSHARCVALALPVTRDGFALISTPALLPKRFCPL